jgi:hypothetical protein
MMLGTSSVGSTPMPPMVKNALVCSPPGLASILPIQQPSSPIASKAVYEQEGNGRPIITGIIDQTSVKQALLPGETLLYASGSAGTNTTSIKLDAAGNVLIASNANSATISITPSGSIVLKTSQHTIDFDLLISTLNQVISQLQTTFKAVDATGTAGVNKVVYAPTISSLFTVSPLP